MKAEAIKISWSIKSVVGVEQRKINGKDTK